MWILFVIYVSCLSCFLVCSLQPCVFVTFPCGVLCQVWYLVILIPGLCLLTYFYNIPSYHTTRYNNSPCHFPLNHTGLTIFPLDHTGLMIFPLINTGLYSRVQRSRAAVLAGSHSLCSKHLPGDRGSNTGLYLPVQSEC